MMNEKRPTRRSRRTMGSLALAGSLTAIAVALGAGDVKTPPTKEQMYVRMGEIAKQVAGLQSGRATRDVRMSIDRLLREYRQLSQTLGGDDPAGLLEGDVSAPVTPADEGGIASAPPAPAGCTSTTVNYANAVATPIPNNSNPANTVVTSTITVSGLDPVIWDVNATTFITHTDSSDLDITLTSPAGTVVTLVSDSAALDNLFNGTVWDDDADPGNPAPYASPLATSNLATDTAYTDLVPEATLVPEDAMGAFIGENPNGVWTLSIADDALIDGGSLDSWSLAIATVPAAPTTTLTSGSVAPAAVIATGPVVVTSIINIAGAPTVITDVNATTTIAHAANADLDITLTSPDGTSVTLTTDNGGTNDNAFNGTVWNDDADPGNQVPFATATFAASNLASDTTYTNLVVEATLVPEEAMAAFIGEDPNGDWTLTVSDDLAANGGTLTSWSVDVLSTATAPTTTTTVFNNTTPVPIEQPAAPTTSTIVVSGAGTFMWDVDLTTVLAHTNAGDLDITLQSPAGTIVTVTTDNGGTLDNVYSGTLWDDDADPDGVAPYSNNEGLVNDATYTNLIAETPLVGEEALSAFIGENPNGTWTITVHDDGINADSGTLTSWNMDITTLDAAPTDSTTLSVSNTTPITFTVAAPPQVFTSTVVVGGAGTFLRDVNFTMNLVHTFAGDIDLTLTSPAGTVVTITTDNAGTSENVFNGTLFNDDADPDGQVPFLTNTNSVSDHPYVDLTVATPLTPEEALAAFIGENPNGTWTLTISDDATGDGGSLNSWSIDVVTCDCSAGPVCDADIDGDSAVDINDLLEVINNWGTCPPPCPPACPADIDPAPAGDCQININDLLLVINSWGPCP